MLGIHRIDAPTTKETGGRHVSTLTNDVVRVPGKKSNRKFRYNAARAQHDLKSVFIHDPTKELESDTTSVSTLSFGAGRRLHPKGPTGTKAIDLFDRTGAASLLRARTRYHLGRCYHRSGRWREAIEILEQVRETFSRYKARPELAYTLLELGQLYHQRQDFESAYIYLKDALRLFRRLKDADGIAVTQEALGSLALQTARLPEAIASLQEARQGYLILRRSERVQAVDNLLQIAHQARQPMGGATQ